MPSPEGGAPPADPTQAPHSITLPFFDSPEFTPRWIDPEDLPDDFHTIPSFTLYNQRGETVTEAALDGNITVVDFFFTACNGICPRLTQSMARIDAAIDPDADFVLLSHSVTPERDTPEVLQSWAEAKGVRSDRWHLLTGERSTIYALGRSAYFIEESLGLEKNPDDFLHTENMVLLDRSRRIRGVYNGVNKASVSQLTKDAQALLAR